MAAIKWHLPGNGIAYLTPGQAVKIRQPNVTSAPIKFAAVASHPLRPRASREAAGTQSAY